MIEFVIIDAIFGKGGKRANYFRESERERERGREGEREGASVRDRSTN